MISFCSKLLNSIPVCLKSGLGVLHVKTISAGDGFLDTDFYGGSQVPCENCDFFSF